MYFITCFGYDALFYLYKMKYSTLFESWLKMKKHVRTKRDYILFGILFLYLFAMVSAYISQNKKLRLLSNGINEYKNYGMFTAYENGEVYYYRNNGIYKIEQSGQESFIVEFGKISSIEIDGDVLYFCKPKNEKQFGGKGFYKYELQNSTLKQINSHGTPQYINKKYKYEEGILYYKENRRMHTFQYNDDIYQIWNRHILKEGEDATETSIYLLPFYQYTSFKFDTEDTIIVLGQTADFHSSEVLVSKEDSDCLIQVNLNTNEKTILFTVDSGNRILFASTKNDLVCYADKEDISFCQLSSFQYITYQYIGNINKCIFEVCGDYLFIYDKKGDFLNKINISEIAS